MDTESKIRTLASASDWRQGQSGPVVFTNGVFDLLHPGHVGLLEAARDLGDTLIVAVNSDASARRLAKGPDRPLVAETARARLVAAMAAVGCVVIFDEDTPLEVIRALKPDVLVKGADYATHQIVGADVVQSYGGRVQQIPLIEAYSTTSLLERIRATS